MYSKKSVGPIMNLWGTPAITGYSCEDGWAMVSEAWPDIYDEGYIH